VKVSRTVYLTINRAVAPFIEMPNLLSMSFRNADMVLRQYGLKLEDTVFKPDFARNSVRGQLYKGENIKPGTQIQQGSAITLVLGNGIGGLDFVVPNLSGLTYHEVRALLDSAHLIAGAVVINKDVKDTAGAYVYKQMPPTVNEDRRPNRIHAGESMDIWLGVQKPEPKTDSTGSQAIH
jgi:beta-lactam-binding protein with PASTA domain